tara:strand:- start:123 stop:773 length:651 start_codon:yes stop_codon:yes gene_type:complete
MKNDILNKLNQILSEGNWSIEEEKNNEFVRSMREMGIHAKDNQVNEELEEDEEKVVSKKENEDSESNEDEDSEEIAKDSDSLKSLIKLEEAQSFGKLVDILNRFRASKSLSDEEVGKELKEYHEKLTRQEKDVLYIFIHGLVQITQQDVDGKAANSPGDMMYGINKKGAVSADKEKSMRLKQSSKEEAEKSSLTPIKIGTSVQEKKEILSILKLNG